MPSFLLVLFTIFILLFLIIYLYIYKKSSNRSTKANSYSQLLTTANEQKYNPDIDTYNWDLHKIRLNKYGRSQYKGLTFFMCPQGRIYYLSEEGTKVYC